MSATGGCGCGCGNCGERAYARQRRRPQYYYRPRSYRSEPEYMVAGGAPQFSARMTFAAALGNNDTNSVGLYRIYRDGRPIYAGRAAPGTIRSRLLQHRWCLTHLGVDTASYTVSFAPMRGSSPANVAAAERDEIRRLRRNRVFRGTNVREGEEMLGLPSWGEVRNWAGNPTGAGRVAGDIWRRVSPSSAPRLAEPIPPTQRSPQMDYTPRRQPPPVRVVRQRSWWPW